LWKYQPPWFFDEFDRLEEVFPAASYQYVLYGMGFRSEALPGDTSGTRAMAQNYRAENAAMTRRMLASLPRNRDLVKKIQEFGLQAV
jgi:tryptophan halogenase